MLTFALVALDPTGRIDLCSDERGARAAVDSIIRRGLVLFLLVSKRFGHGFWDDGSMLTWPDEESVYVHRIHVLGIDRSLEPVA